MRIARMVAALALAGFAGCGSEEDHYKLVRVTGTVTRNGKPLANANVSFLPAASNSPTTPGVDETGPEGNYLLKFRNRTGIAPGSYKVVITPPVELPGGAPIPEAFKDDPIQAQMAMGIGVPGAEPKKKEIIKNEFQAEVTADQKEPFDFDVKTGPIARGNSK